MQSVGWAALEVIPSMKGFEGKLSAQTNPILSRSGVSGGAKFGDSAGRSMSSRFVSHAKTAAILAGGVLTGVAAIGIKIGKESVDEAREAQRVGAITARVIKSTGQAANVTAKQVGKLSTAISNRVGIDDEAIQSGANLLLTFKNIQNQVGKDNKVFDEATKITTDMAVAMAGGNGGSVDLKSSSILVGKALNDPVKGLTALTRVGVSFTDQQTKNIKSLVEQGKTMDAQKIILKELQSEFGGTAAAQATMGDKVKVAWGNIEESIGTTLLPLIDDVERAFLKKGVPALEHFSDWFAHDGKKGIGQFINEAKPLANSILPAAKNGLKDIADFLSDAAPKAKAVIDAFNKLPDWAQKAVVLGTAGGVIAKKTGLLNVGKSALTGGGGTGGGLLGLVSKAKPVPVFVVNEGFGGKGLPGAGGKTGAGGGGGIPIAKIGLLAGLVTAGDIGNEVPDISGRGLPLGPKEFLDAVRAGRIADSQRFNADLLKAYGLTNSQAQDLLHLKASTTRIDGLRASLQKTSRELDLVKTKGGQSFKAAATSAAEYKALLNRLPKRIQTAIETPGMVETRRDLRELLRGMGLTPKQIRTEFELLGLDRAKRQVDVFRSYAGRHISAELQIELPSRQTPLDGVRRR